MQIGERVILTSLMFEDNFKGEIIELHWLHPNVCTVKLDEWVHPVRYVLYYPEQPEVVESSLWQICWPDTEKLTEGANPDEPSCVHSRSR